MGKTFGSIREATREIPISGEFDVIVAGGGPAGIGAATAAARAGAKTLILERYGYLGGMATAGLVVPHFDCTVNLGLNMELIERLEKLGGWGAAHWKISFDPELFKHVSEAIVLESGAEVLYHCLAVSPITEGNEIRGVVVESKSGRHAFLGKVVIDSTGDGDIAARAGAPYQIGRESDGLMQPMTHMFRLGGVDWVQTKAHELFDLCQKAIEETGDTYRLPFNVPWAIHLPNPREVVLQLVHVRGVDGTDVGDLTRAEIEGRRQALEAWQFLKSRVPEFAESYFIETAAQIGVRETRRITGEYTVNVDDVLDGRAFEDGIANVTFPIDIHDPVDKSQPVEAVGRRGTRPRGSYQIPYRSLVPLEVEQLLVAGRCISGTHEAHASYRVKGPCLAMGQAAGTAAALSIREGVRPRHLDSQLLVATLEEQGVRLKLGDEAQKPKQEEPARKPSTRPYLGPG